LLQYLFSQKHIYVIEYLVSVGLNEILAKTNNNITANTFWVGTQVSQALF